MKSKKTRKTFDELFKERFKQFFEKFSTVKTEYEILKLPRKIDVLVIEEDKPIPDFVLLFTYFKKINIVEFKSETDRFRKKDLYKIGHYSYGILLKEKEASKENTTFTLVTTLKPHWLINDFGFKEIKKGLYKSDKISIIGIYIVVIEELDPILKKEYRVLKEFTSKKDREKVLRLFLSEESNDTEDVIDDLFLLYEIEMVQILKSMGKDMTAVKERALEFARKYGITDEDVYQKGREEGRKAAERKARKEKLRAAISIKARGLDIDFIVDVTKLNKAHLEKFFRKVKL